MFFSHFNLLNSNWSSCKLPNWCINNKKNEEVIWQFNREYKYLQFVMIHDPIFHLKVLGGCYHIHRGELRGRISILYFFCLQIQFLTCFVNFLRKGSQLFVVKCCIMSWFIIVFKHRIFDFYLRILTSKTGKCFYFFYFSGIYNPYVVFKKF